MLGTKKKTLREQLLDQASDLAGSLAPHVENARDKAAPVLADARDRAVPVLTDARDKAAPYVADARDKAAPYVADARDKISTAVLPVITAALASVDEATEDVRDETMKRGKAVAAALKGEVEAPPEKKHRFRTLLMLLGLGGIAFAAYKKLGSKQPTTNWQSSYTPPPAPTPSTGGGPVAGGAAAGAHRADEGDDTAASDPAEAASDATDVPHGTTTPDNPVEEIDVNKE
jgi:vacuolar-type H+-ATPase subunit H